jgi:hypothetical protein
MNVAQERPGSLPVRQKLTLAYILSFIVALIMGAVSIAGLIYRSGVYPTGELLRAFVSNDVVNLFIGLPILLGSMWVAQRGKLIGLLCWPGALFYVLYNYIVYVFAMPLNAAFLLHLALVMLSAYTIIFLVAAIDGNAVQQKLVGAIHERVSGGILAGLGLLFFLRAAGVMIGALTSHVPMAGADFALNTADFLITPAWIIGGVLLWWRKELGYVAGLGLLYQASMLFIALITVLLLQPVFSDQPFVLSDIVVVFGMGLICFIPFVLFVRGVMAKRVLTRNM